MQTVKNTQMLQIKPTYLTRKMTCRLKRNVLASKLKYCVWRIDAHTYISRLNETMPIGRPP